MGTLDAELGLPDLLHLYMSAVYFNYMVHYVHYCLVRQGVTSKDNSRNSMNYSKHIYIILNLPIEIDLNLHLNGLSINFELPFWKVGEANILLTYTARD